MRGWVPLIVRGPDVPAGRMIDHLAVDIDQASTFARLGRVSMPQVVYGQLLLGHCVGFQV